MAEKMNQESEKTLNQSSPGKIVKKPTPKHEGKGDTAASNGPVANGSNFETRFFGNFVTPMLSKLEADALKTNEMLDEILRTNENEREERWRKDQSKHIPEVIQGDGQKLEDILKNLEDLIIYENQPSGEGQAVKARLKDLTTVTEATILSHGIAAYISTLSYGHLRRLSARVYDDVSIWLSRLFRLDKGLAYFHDDEREGLVRVGRLSLLRAYANYVHDGYTALQDHQPVIYTSAAAVAGQAEYLCAQLGLPNTSISTVPLYKNTHRMDIAELARRIDADESSGRRPVLLISQAGTPVLGHVDEFKEIAELCGKHNVWMHVEGNAIALLTYFTVPTAVTPVRSGNSLALNLGGWLGVPSLPQVTLFEAPQDIELAKVAGLIHGVPKGRLIALPVWVTLQQLGHYGIVDRIKHAVSMSMKVHEKINAMRTVKNLTFFEIENPTVVFKYCKDTEKEQQSEEPGESQAVQTRDNYFDSLNIWLCETLKRECPKIILSVVDMHDDGNCIRFAPMESIHDYDTTQGDLDTFLDVLGRQVSILDATVKKRQDFIDMVKEKENLVAVHLPKWAGLGAVMYIPTHIPKDSKEWNAAQTNEVNNINYELVQRLKMHDSAFSLGQNSSGLFCARFGLVTAETDIDVLLGMVYTVAQEAEEASRFLETMAAQIREGIFKAEHDLEEEHQHRLQQEGVLRQIPMVGSLINWWSPTPKDAVKGRAFNLTSGKVMSTEEIYKHKMQIQESQYNSELRHNPHHDGPYKSSLKQPTHAQHTDIPNGPKATSTDTPNGPSINTDQNLTPGDSPQPSPKGSLVITTPQTPDQQPRA